MENIVDSQYNKALVENETNLKYHEDYKKSHEQLISNLNSFRDQFEPNVLVPVCNKVLMKGNLIHTNEVMVSIGCGYLIKCTVAKAQEICQRRISKVNDIIQNLEREKDYLESQMKFREENLFSTKQHEIIEDYDEEKEKYWRIKHAMKLKEHRIKENMEMRSMDHDSMYEKFELLELQEEIENLYTSNTYKQSELKQHLTNNSVQSDKKSLKTNQITEEMSDKKDQTDLNEHESVKHNDKPNFEQSRELILRKKLADLRQRKREKCVTEEDIFKRLDELEEEEELEDELDRLYEDIYSNKDNEENDTEENDTEKEDSENEQQNSENSIGSNRRVSFPKTGVEIQTLNIYFKHGENEIEKSNQDDNSLTSPSDIYKMFPENFKTNKLKGIIKNCHKVIEETHNSCTDTDENVSPSKINMPKILNVGEVVEKQNETEQKLENKGQRPVSKFKAMRLASKKSNE